MTVMKEWAQGISIANTLEILQYCTKVLIRCSRYYVFYFSIFLEVDQML